MVRVFALVMFIVGNLLFAQQAKEMAKDMALETVLIETFRGESLYPGTDIPIEWTTKASKDTAVEFPKTMLTNVWPTDKYGINSEKTTDLKSFSVHASFKKKGYNWVEVNSSRDVDGKKQLVPFVLPGMVKKLSVWVWGSNYNHTLDAVLIDAEGIQHRLSLGKLNFYGWKNMSVTIPSNVQQFSKKRFQPYLKFKGFLLTTNPVEVSDNFYFYLSDITVSTRDRRYYEFDGSELIKPEKISELWGEDLDTIMAGLGPESNPIATVQGQTALPPVVGSDNPAYQKLKEVSLTEFDNSTAWEPSISSDFGTITLTTVEGGPVEARPLSNETNEAGDNDQGGSGKKVLGGKVSFRKRGLTPIQVISANPIDVNGIVKVVSVWVSGRNVPHKMSLLLKDWDGRILKLYMGKLNFMGWRQLSVAIPARVKQRGFLNTRIGVQVLGFEIDTDLVESRGTYYFYLGDLRAWVDLSAFPLGGGAGDPVDTW